MPIVVEAMEPEKYAQWVSEQKKKAPVPAVDSNKILTLDELKTQGEKIYASTCAACHQPNGKGIGTFPALDGSKIANGPKAEHIKMVMHGKAGTAMASFKQLSDADIAAVVTYERNAWGNKSGDAVQPSEIKQYRN